MDSFFRNPRNANFDKFEQRADLTELRCPRSSVGSFRSLTASITAERRSTSFFSGFSDLLDDDGDEEEEAEEARRSLPWPIARGGFSVVDLQIRGDEEDDEIALASRIAMTRW